MDQPELSEADVMSLLLSIKQQLKEEAAEQAQICKQLAAHQQILGNQPAPAAADTPAVRSTPMLVVREDGSLSLVLGPSGA